MNNVGRKKRVLLRDVAERAGVSVGTASSVFAGKTWVSEETHTMVHKAAEELGYRPRLIPAQMRSQTVTTLGLVVRRMPLPLPINPFYASILHGAEQACADRDVGLMYAIVDEDVTHIEDLPVMLQRKQVQGLLVAGYFNDEFFLLLQRLQIPFVLIDHVTSSVPTDCVNPDDEAGGYQATHYLIKNGHRHPAMIAGDLKHVSVRNRLHGYQRALKDAGITYDETYVRWGTLDTEGGYQEMSALLNLKSPPTAVFCCNDLTALGALDALREHKIAVPEQCSIIGYDDIDMAVRSVPPLTTIRAEKDLLGKQGVWHLLERVAEPEMASRHTVIGVELIERRSTQKKQ